MNGDVIFELIGDTKGMYADGHNERRFRQERPFAIPAVATIIDEKAEVGDEGSVAQIRYIANQRSPYIDKQNIPDGASLTRAVSKPQFTMGHIVVRKSQRNLLEFMRLHPMNEDNQHWGLPRQKAIFRERKPEEQARKVNESVKNQINAVRLVFESDFTTKTLPIAKYLKINTQRPSDLVLHDLKLYAESNPESFTQLLESAVVTRYDEVMKAHELGVIKVEPHRITWGDGRQITQVPANYDAAEYFSEITFDEAHRTTWREVQRLMGQLGSSEDDAETIASATPTGDFLELDIDTFVEELKHKKIAVWDTYDREWKINERKVAKNTDELKAYAEENKNELAARLFE
jgi:hypothetical protein